MKYKTVHSQVKLTTLNDSGRDTLESQSWSRYDICTVLLKILDSSTEV